MTADCLLRVTGVRKLGAWGGAIFTAKPIGADGMVQDANRYYVVKASSRVLGGMRVERGQWWHVAGRVSTRSVLTSEGYAVSESQLEADSAEMRQPSGEHIIVFMAESAAFEGVGMVKARRLWDTFGERLYALLDSGDVASLAAVISEDTARTVAQAWALHGTSRVLQWLQAQGFSVALGRKLIQFFGSEAQRRIEDDPYRLLSFCADWQQVDALARSQFDIALDDPRRLQGAIEEACYRLFTDGHTLATPKALKEALVPLLGKSSANVDGPTQLEAILELGQTNGSYVVGLEGLQPVGPMAMERTVASAIAARLALGESARLLPALAVDAIIKAHEAAEGIILNAEQRTAIHMANAHGVACITGGAGVGKTTVLKTLCEVYDEARVKVVQVALAGRAAKRMAEATGRDASTIASFLRNLHADTFDAPTVMVVDEASMVDIVAMSSMVEVLPPHARILLVGDPHQLMPVGPGLVLHVVATLAQVPCAELKVVKRFGNDIGQAAKQVRTGHWPVVSHDDTARVSFVPCDEADITARVFALYRGDPNNTQILAACRTGPAGTRAVNAYCQAELTASAPPLKTWNTEFECAEHTGFHLNDVVLCTRNRWDRGLQNGSLGRIVELEPAPRPLIDEVGADTGTVLAWVMWDDSILRPLTEDMLDDLELGYAITVHKAQGSQWPVVIVPATRTRMLDRTLLYTSMTRAQTRVVFVGNEAAAAEAVARIPRAQLRRTALLAHLLKAIDTIAV